MTSSIMMREITRKHEPFLPTDSEEIRGKLTAISQVSGRDIMCMSTTDMLWTIISQGLGAVSRAGSSGPEAQGN